MQILKGTGIDWRERRLISNLYMAQSVKVRLNRGEKSIVMIGRGVIQECCLSPILFNLCSECLTKEALKGFEHLKIGGQIINSVKYADDLVLLVICLVGLLAPVNGRHVDIRYKFKRSTFIQEPMVIEGVEYREKFKREMV
jgi:hypothetical protein